MYKAIAVVFPGQGSQSVGMLSPIADVYPQVKEVFGQASTILDYDLWNLVQDGPQKQLNTTEYTQPALLASSIAIWQLLDKNILPKVVTGHSLGEYSALVAAEVISFEDAISLVRYRGQFMQQAVPEGQGAVAAILGLANTEVNRLCEEISGDEYVAGVNFNAPGQVVVAGHASAVQKLLVSAKEAGAKRAVVLPISVPVHCKLMSAAAKELKTKLQDISFQAPKIGLVQNVSCQLEDDPSRIKQNLIEQLVRPVDWVKIIKYIAASEINLLMECGPGNVLSSLNKRILPDIETVSVGAIEQLNDFVGH